MSRNLVGGECLTMRVIDKIVDAIMAANMLFAVVIAATAVFYRYVLDSSLSWSFELLLVLLTYMTFIGCYAAMRRGTHLRVDVIVRMLPRIPQTIVFVFAQLLILLVAVVMVRWGFEQFMRFGDRNTTMLEIPRGYLYIIIPISGLAMALETIRQLIRGIRRCLRGELPEEPEYPEETSTGGV